MGGKPKTEERTTQERRRKRTLKRSSRGREGLGDPHVTLIQWRNKLWQAKREDFPIRRGCNRCEKKPQHLICFKQWTADMVMTVIQSALNLKSLKDDTHGTRMDLLSGHKVMILQEINEPILNMAVSKAATFLGASDVNITDKLFWDNDYNGRVFSFMCDAIFVSTSTHMCLQRFANKSTVPVLCMKSRTHAAIQAMSTFMAVIEEFSTVQDLNFSYVGQPHPVLNSYLLLCPMLGANIRFKCGCDRTPVSPLLLKASQDMTAQMNTEGIECKTKEEVLKDACVIIAGPTTNKKDKPPDFKLKTKDIPSENWIFFHTCPRGSEIDDDLFNHSNARTFHAYENMQFIVAALLAYTIKGSSF